MDNDLTNTLGMLLDTLGIERAVRLLDTVSTPAKCHALQVEIQTRYALRLLHAGNTRPQIRDRLASAYGLSRDTCYQRINAAIERRMRQPNWLAAPPTL